MKSIAWLAAVAAGTWIAAGPPAAAEEKLIFATISPAGNAMNAKVLIPWATRRFTNPMVPGAVRSPATATRRVR